MTNPTKKWRRERWPSTVEIPSARKECIKDLCLFQGVRLHRFVWIVSLDFST